MASRYGSAVTSASAPPEERRYGYQDLCTGRSVPDRLPYDQGTASGLRTEPDDPRNGIQGVNIDEKRTANRWRVENSWGPDAGRDGYYTMTDRWFDEYTYQIVVNRKYLPKRGSGSYEQGADRIKALGPDGISGIRRKRKSRFFQEKGIAGAKTSVREKKRLRRENLGAL